MKKFETLRCIFLLFSVSTSIQDISLYMSDRNREGGSPTALGAKQDSENANDFRELNLKLQNFGKGANIYEVDPDLALKMNEARNKFVKQWIK